MQFCCIIPFYNEQKRLQHAHIQHALNHSNIQFIFIDDGSKDNTYTHLLKYQTQFPNLVILQNPSNQGKAQTIQKGMQYAHNHFHHIKFVAFFDADFATPFHDLYLLFQLSAQKNADIVFASRIKTFNTQIKRNFFRHVFSRIFYTFLNMFFKLNIYDTQCGCKVFKTQIIPLLFNHKFLSRWLFDIELFIRYFHATQNTNIIENPISQWHDVKGSKLGLKDIPLIFIDFFKIIIHYKFYIK